MAYSCLFLLYMLSLLFSFPKWCLEQVVEIFFLPMRHYIFSGAGKFCLAHGLRQLICDVKSDVRTLNFRSDVIYVYFTTPINTE